MFQLIYVNGKFIPKYETCISVMDRGFLFGDGVYEVLPAFGGRMFRLLQHLERLNNSLRAVRITPPHTHEEWESILTRLLDQEPQADSSVYLQVTRGVATSRDHAMPSGITPTVFAMASPIPANNAALNAKGIAAITREDFRWQRCDIKAITLLANVLLRQEAIDTGAMDAVLIRDGLATEGAASNLFIVLDGILITPPKSQYLLPGITRDLILELVTANQLPHKIAPITLQELTTAEEVWLTSSVREIMPVVRLDNRLVGSGYPGTYWQQVNTLYQAFKANMRIN